MATGKRQNGRETRAAKLRWVQLQSINWGYLISSCTGTFLGQTVVYIWYRWAWMVKIRAARGLPYFSFTTCSARFCWNYCSYIKGRQRTSAKDASNKNIDHNNSLPTWDYLDQFSDVLRGLEVLSMYMHWKVDIFSGWVGGQREQMQGSLDGWTLPQDVRSLTHKLLPSPIPV